MKFRKKPVVTFTDDDLKRLKEECANHKHESCCDLMSLLSRLEAAEAYIKAKSEAPYKGAEAYEAWRKAAGK